MRLLIHNLKQHLSLLMMSFSCLIISMNGFANQPPTVIVEIAPPLLTQAEIQQGLQEMQKKMNSRIEQWGSKLTRNDFERKRGKLVLKSSKQLEVCGIYQGVIDETYQSAQKNKHRLTAADQKVIEHKQPFIQALGIQNNIIPTKLGFDCRIQ